jgi:hypothetical protein
MRDVPRGALGGLLLDRMECSTWSTEVSQIRPGHKKFPTVGIGNLRCRRVDFKASTGFSTRGGPSAQETGIATNASAP